MLKRHIQGTEVPAFGAAAVIRPAPCIGMCLPEVTTIFWVVMFNLFDVRVFTTFFSFVLVVACLRLV